MSGAPTVASPSSTSSAPDKEPAGAPLAISSRALWWFGAALVALQVAQILGRSHAAWIDVRWAWSQYLFSLVMFGPLAAAGGAWQGRALIQAGWLARIRPWRGAWLFIAPVTALALTVFLGGLVAQFALCVVTGAPVDLLVADSVDGVIAVVGVVTYVLAGAAIGAALRWRVVVPLAAGAAFGLTMWAWIAGMDVLVKFGGATGGLTGYATRPGQQLVRLAFLLVVAAGCALVVRERLGWSRGTRRGVVGAVVAVAVLFGIAGSVDDELRAVPVAWACAGKEPTVCVPGTAKRFLPDLMTAVDRQGLAHQVVTASPRTATTLRITDDLLLARVARVGAAPDREVGARIGIEVSNRLMAPYCLSSESPESWWSNPAVEQLGTWISYYTSRDADDVTTPADAGIPDAPIGSPAATTFLATTLAQLPPCPKG
ncbi:hypothetical protein [Luteimicrobium subarcticum]|uniref:Uncharacterized protein n=1 Tax=Luteimicrobium subarcticum TaxID=620910 RepID=A0A2M8W1Q8_9MICO|nr:hypothetical protein [Luteimicrobium subarcticum]PJI84863.1 hypothetical protein CLV34_3108 [Luteimicrobium subarcticum]